MIKLLIADHHPIIRKGLELLFSASSNIQIVASLDDGEAIIDFVKKNPVDIILTEIDLPKLNGLTVLRILKNDFPDIKTIIFSGQPEEVYAINSIKAGASGYISKASSIKRDAQAAQLAGENKLWNIFRSTIWCWIRWLFIFCSGIGSLNT